MGRPRRHPLWAETRWLLLISGIFSLSIGLSNTFVNIYLWKVDHSYIPIGWYNLAVYVFMPIAFIVAASMANRMYAVKTIRIGILLHAAFYLLALLGGTGVASLPFFLGAIMGTAQGFYWYSFNFLSLRLTESETRDSFYGFNGAMVASAHMTAPIVAGFLISAEDRLGGLTGYHVIFALSLILFVAATVVSLKLRTMPMNGHLSFRQAVGLLQRKPWRHILAGCYFYGLREGVFLFLIGLLMYIATGSELRLGEFLFLQNFLSFLSFYTVGKLLKPGNRIRVLGTGAVTMALAALLFLTPITTTMIIVYGVAVAVSLPIFIVPLQGLVFDTISGLDKSGEQHDEQIIAREVVENGGRVTGLAVFLIIMNVNSGPVAVSRLAIVLGFVQLFSWLVIWRGHRTAGGGDGQVSNRRFQRTEESLKFGRTQSPS